MSVAITAQVPRLAASSPATASPQAGQGTGATSEQGLVDFFAKARVDAANGNMARGDQFRSFERGDAREVARVRREGASI